MDNEEAPIKNDSKEPYLKDSEEEYSKKSLKTHIKSIKEHRKMFKNLKKYDRKLIRGFMRGFGKTMMLWLISKKRQHGYEIMTQLHGASPVKAKIKMPSPSMIYPVLHDLEKNGLIKGSWEHHGKRKLKYYEITKEGTETLSRIRNLFKNRETNLYEEFVEDMFFK